MDSIKNNKALNLSSELYHDNFADVPNIYYLYSSANEYVRNLRNNNDIPVLLYVNIYGMRLYNKQFGFSEGNKILTILTRALYGVFEDSIVCHASEDHFIVLTKQIGIEDNIRSIAEIVGSEAKSKFLTIKVGAYIAEDTNYFNTYDAYDKARFACGLIHDDAGKNLNYFDKEDFDQYEKELYIIGNIRNALDEHQVKVYYQPICNIKTGKLVAFEALARWIDSGNKVIGPGDFIPEIERHHIISLLDNYMLNEICKEWKDRQQVGLGNIPISLNISKDDFRHEDVSDFVINTINNYNIPHNLIIVEITESTLYNNYANLKEQLLKLKSAGIKIWMDDFGSEYSSIGMLQTMDVDLIKLDINFLRSIDENKNNERLEKSTKLLESAIKLAKSLNIHTLCEGAETKDQLELLDTLGCENAQGFYFGKPEPLNETYKAQK